MKAGPSPDLGITVLSTHSDPRTGDTTYKQTNIQRSEPPRSLFEVPSDYRLIESAFSLKNAGVTGEPPAAS